MAWFGVPEERKEAQVVGQHRTGQADRTRLNLALDVDGDGMVRALLPRATRSGLTETKPTVTRTPGRWRNQRGWRAGARCGVGAAIGRGSLRCNEGLTRTERGLRGTQRGTEGRRILSQGRSNKRTGQGTTKYASAEGAVRYDVVRAGAGRHWSGRK